VPRLDLEMRGPAAASPVQASSLLDKHPNTVLLMTDVVMPGMKGRKLAEEALRRRPDLKVLFTTGYTRNAIVYNGTLDDAVQRIVKPFTLWGPDWGPDWGRDWGKSDVAEVPAH
jgi:DNA-binding NtrC family response regulator